jgi:hypothetical protein
MLRGGTEESPTLPPTRLVVKKGSSTRPRCCSSRRRRTHLKFSHSAARPAELVALGRRQTALLPWFVGISWCGPIPDRRIACPEHGNTRTNSAGLRPAYHLDHPLAELDGMATAPSFFAVRQGETELRCCVRRDSGRGGRRLSRPCRTGRAETANAEAPPAAQRGAGIPHAKALFSSITRELRSVTWAITVNERMDPAFADPPRIRGTGYL